MSEDRTIVIAVEDIATAGVVAAAAAHIGMEHDTSTAIFLHVLDDYTTASGMFTFAGAALQTSETAAEGASVLDLAEAAFRAEYTALDRPLPSISRDLCSGKPGAAVARLAEDAKATAIVVGARRPHAFGRLTHPDVRASLTHHTRVPVHVVSLQAGEEETPGGPVH